MLWGGGGAIPYAITLQMLNDLVVFDGALDVIEQCAFNEFFDWAVVYFRFGATHATVGS